MIDGCEHSLMYASSRLHAEVVQKPVLGRDLACVAGSRPAMVQWGGNARCSRLLKLPIHVNLAVDA
jgi:hypothetical protein